MIQVEGLSKIYRVAEKQPGLAGTLRHFIRRRTRDVTAVQDVSFRIEPGEMVLSLIHIPSPRDRQKSRMPSSA